MEGSDSLTRSIPEDLILRAERRAKVSGRTHHVFIGPDGDWWVLTEEEAFLFFGWKLEDVVYSTR